jgi:hypothetical protein
MQKALFKPVAPVALPVDYSDIDTFVTNIQKFIALQFYARCAMLIETFGEDVGIEYAERFAQYGVWFLIHKMDTGNRDRFYKLVLHLPNASPNTEGT